MHFNREGKILKPPIFNRVILRKDNKFKIIFPDPFDDEIKELVKYEMENYNRLLLRNCCAGELYEFFEQFVILNTLDNNDYDEDEDEFSEEEYD